MPFKTSNLKRHWERKWKSFSTPILQKQYYDALVNIKEKVGSQIERKAFKTNVYTSLGTSHLVIPIQSFLNVAYLKMMEIDETSTDS